MQNLLIRYMTSRAFDYEDTFSKLMKSPTIIDHNDVSP